VEAIKDRVPGVERLQYAGKNLPDTSTLAANGIPKEATLDALGRLFGGGKGSGGGASKSKKGVAAGTNTNARPGSSNQAVGAAASSVDARRQTTTSHVDALAAKDREIAALQRRIDEFELLARTPPRSPASLSALKLQVDKLESQLREQNLISAKLTSQLNEKRNDADVQMLTHTASDPSPQSQASLPPLEKEAVGQSEDKDLDKRTHSSVPHVGSAASGNGAVEATSTAEDASLRLVFANFADCNLNADALQHRLSKDALAKALADADLKCTNDELEDLVARFDLNSDGEINFDEFRIMVNNNSDVAKVLKSLAIEDVLAAFMPKGAADNALSAFFDMNQSQVKTAVLAAVEPVTELIWAAIAKAAKAAQRQSGGGGGKMGGPLQGGTLDEFYQVKTHTFHARTLCSNMKADMQAKCLHRMQVLFRTHDIYVMFIARCDMPRVYVRCAWFCAHVSSLSTGCHGHHWRASSRPGRGCAQGPL